MPEDQDRGPLPIADGSDALMRESVDALRGALPKDRFLIRDEKVSDFGVDASLELLDRTHATNLRSQLQIKARSGTETNSDGSVSLQLPVKTMNYLLNGPSPMVVLYRSESRELRFVWLRDEAERIRLQNPKWKEQGSVTLRFVKIVDASSLDEMHQRIDRENGFDRSAHEALVRLSDRDAVSLTVDPRELRVSTPEDNARVLEKSGFAIVAYGSPSRVVDLFRTLSEKDVTARVSLTYAYASYEMGKFLDAEATLAEVQTSVTDLDTEDRHFFEYLSNVVGYRVGRLSEEEYEASHRELRGGASGELALQLKLEDIRQKLGEIRRDEELNTLLTEADRILDSIANLPDNAWPLKCRAKLLTLFIRSGAWTRELTNTMGAMQSGPAISRLHFRGGSARESLVKLMEDWRSWEDELTVLLEELRTRVHPPMLCEAIVMRAGARVHFLGLSRLIEIMYGTTPFVLTSPPIDMKPELEMAIEIAERARLSDEGIRAKLTLADILELSGDQDGAAELARSVREVAKAMRYEALVKWADSHISGQSHLKRLETDLAQFKQEDEDHLMSEMSDNDVEEYTRDMVSLLGIPEERTPVVLREAERMRALAKLRVDFCRHLNMLEHLEHTQSHDTIYVRDPERKCICEKYGYESHIENRNWETVIAAFQGAYCAKCDGHSPKGPRSKTGESAT